MIANEIVIHQMPNHAQLNFYSHGNKRQRNRTFSNRNEN